MGPLKIFPDFQYKLYNHYKVNCPEKVDSTAFEGI